MKNSGFSIGVDGGGSKTELILVDSAGAIVATHTAPGCNPSQTGPEKAGAIIQASLESLCRGIPPGSVQQTLLCMAGSMATWREITSGLTGYGSIQVVADSIPVLELATSGAPGLVLHAGTGSFVAARAPDRSVHYAGGLGWRFGDSGSAFDLGRRGIALALLELQGWARPTPLGDAFKAHTGLGDYAANSWFFYNDPAANARIAAFAPRIVDLAAQGCIPAQAVLTDTLTELVELAGLVTAKLFGGATVPCGVSGALLNAEPALVLLKQLAASRHWLVEFNFITTPPIEGVRRLLLADR